MRQVLALFAVLGLLSTACGGGNDGAGEGSLRLTFDGDTCAYEGPTKLKAGPASIDFVNAMEEPAEDEWRLVFKVNLTRHDGDKTVQDAVDYIGPEPSTKRAPSWVFEVDPPTWDESVFPGQTVNWEGDLEPGTYSMICAYLDPFGVWFGTGLTVEG